MNDLLNTEALRELVQVSDYPCVSIYMPAHPITPDAQQDPIRLRNLLDEVEEALVQAALRVQDVRALLDPARRLLDDVPFWQHQSTGLALFLSPQVVHHFRLPLEFAEFHIVAERFHVKPLLPYFTEDGQYYVLALSQNNVRLLRGTRHILDEVAVEGMPASQAEALRFDDPESQLQFHTGTAPQAGSQGRAAQFHGHGVGTDDAKTNLLRYFQQVDRALDPILNSSRAPLVLAGVEYLHPIFAEASGYRHLLTEGITGNPDQLSSKEIQALAWPVVEPIFRTAREAVHEQYGTALAHNLASHDLPEVLVAAHSGRVATAFTRLGSHRWGTFDTATFLVRIEDESTPENEDLTDLVAVQTLLHGGEVHALAPDEMPDGAEVAAIYRY
jgi:hypothetical protein